MPPEPFEMVPFLSLETNIIVNDSSNEYDVIFGSLNGMSLYIAPAPTFGDTSNLLQVIFTYDITS